MSARGYTRQAAFEAACTLAASGRRPTVETIREAFGGRGGQQAIQQGLADWVDEAAQRFQVPGIPEELRGAVVAVWDLACKRAQERWSQDRAALGEQMEALAAEGATAVQEREAARAEGARLQAALAEQGAVLRKAEDALDGARSALEARTAALRERDAALVEARAQGADEALRRAHSERLAAAARASLEAAQERVARLRTELEVADARTALIERAETAANERAAQARTDLVGAQTTVVELRRALSERDGQLAALTATLKGEQRGREADSRHWLARLEERQTEVTAARAREAAWGEEKRRLVEELAQLKREVHRLRLPPPALPPDPSR
jgi:hypothetical protein